jgi:hypothetical protein
VRQLLLKKDFFASVAIIGLLLFFGCEKKYDTIIDSIGNAPTLSEAIISPDTIQIEGVDIDQGRNPDDLVNISLTAQVRASHPDGKNGIIGVTYSAINPSTSELYATGQLADDGQLPDVAPGDSLYCSIIRFNIRRYTVGKFLIQLSGQGHDGYQSSTISLPLQIFRLDNHAPTLSHLIAPDSLPLGSLLKITIQANDSDGLADIYSVSYRTLKPDSTYANSGNPIHMFDDGKAEFPSGDAAANDGIYTYSTNVPSNAALGTYVYTFFAFDRSSASSDTIVHRMTIYRVIQP